MSSIESVCLFRLSALGDVCNSVPLVRALQDQLPRVRIDWIIDRSAAPLVRGLEGVELIVHDKRGGAQQILQLRRLLAGRRYDVLLHTQRSLRANLLSWLVAARVRVGYDRQRSRELHGLAVNFRIPPAAIDQHVVDCFLSFLLPVGLRVPARPRWDLPLSDEDQAFARQHIRDGDAAVVISPGSSYAARVWRPEHYAAVADYAVRRHGLKVLLCGGPGAAERALGAAIAGAMREPCGDLIGKDTPSKFLALTRRALLVISPDSGPAHLANAAGARVLGLYAATDCRRSGPYFSRDLCVNEYAAAARRFGGHAADELPWGKHFHVPGVMDLVLPVAVMARLDDAVSAARRIQEGQGN